MLKITTPTIFQTDDLVYYIAVGTITGKNPEIAACSYDGKLHIYSREGKRKWSLDWSTTFTCLALADVEGKGSTALLSGSLDGKIRIFSQRGTPIWQKDLQQPVICCGAGDIDGDGAAEVSAGLEGEQVVFLDNDGALLWKKTLDSPIVATKIADFNSDGEVEVIVAEANGTIHLYASSGRERFILELKEPISNFSLINTPKEALFVTNNKTAQLKFWDADGNLRHRYHLPSKVGSVKFITSGPLFEAGVDVVILSSRNDLISVLKLLISNGKQWEESGSGLKEIAPRDFDIAVIKELILSITLEQSRITLEELDREIREALNRKVDYNLRELLSKMLQKNQLLGYFEGNEFVRNTSYLWGEE
ncbi:MAG: PQQ-binding-like beta-propeller repeat protein [Candidatus Heimdallarchaeota archaeon]|nr:PQQ-binding-like beta-propeller repeat protein [Candidatus Heimdallarchaeota archaeon]